MKARWIGIALLLAVGPAARHAWADAQEDLNFATRLGAHGLHDMAWKVLDDLERSGSPEAARYGRYGKASLDKQKASIARLRFLRALEDGTPPPVTREQVLKIYEDAKPKVEEYVANRADDLDARFLLGELLQEYAEFLVGADYPDELSPQREQLVSEKSGEAEKLFEAAIGHYAEVAKRMREALAKVSEWDLEDPRYVRLSQAMYNKAHARQRWALSYPKGPKFNYRSEEAMEELDALQSEHYEDIFGAYAWLDLGVLSLERGLRQGSEDDAETAVNYFSTLFQTVKEDPSRPETIEVIAKAFYYYAKTCNAIARGDGALKRPRPVEFEKTIRGGQEMRQRLRHGAKHPFALRAQLLVAEAYAAQDRINEAVSLAGETLATARVQGHRQIAAMATDKLTGWVGRVTGAGALAPGLLFQIGESLATQDRTASAITFFEKAMAAARTEEEREKWAYPARVRIAKEYRRDRRLHAAARIAWQVVDEYLKSGIEEGPLQPFAEDACNTARLAWKQIAESTNRSKDQSEYERVATIFRDRFPGHPENSDAAFTTARDLYTKGRYQEAAEALKNISPASRNYWLAQRLVAACYRSLATDAQDPAKAKEWHQKTLAASQALVKLAETKSEEPGADSARQQAHLFTAMALASLEQWPEALKTIDEYLTRYPDKLIQRGLEYMLKVEAHLALGQLAEAETALAAMAKRTAPTSSIYRRTVYNVFSALRTAYKEAGSRDERLPMAQRAALLLETWLEHQNEQDYKLKYFLGEVYKDAERWGDASAAYEAAADQAVEEGVRQGLILKAADMNLRAIESNPTMDTKSKLKELEKTRDLFTDVLIPPDPKDPAKAEQMSVLKELGNPQGWPSREAFDKVKRNASALLTAADLYAKSSPAGVDGRYVALRLIHHLHSFTIPVEDPGKPNLTEFIETYWQGVELKLKTYLAIAESGAGTFEKTAATDGYAYARATLFQYPSMDRPERVAEVKRLEAQLRVRAGK